MNDETPVTFDELERLINDRRRLIAQREEASKRLFDNELQMQKAIKERDKASEAILNTETKIKQLGKLLGQ